MNVGRTRHLLWLAAVFGLCLAALPARTFATQQPAPSLFAQSAQAGMRQPSPTMPPPSTPRPESHAPRLPHAQRHHTPAAIYSLTAAHGRSSARRRTTHATLAVVVSPRPSRMTRRVRAVAGPSRATAAPQ